MRDRRSGGCAGQAGGLIMRAFVCKSFAGPDAPRIGEIEKLQPAAGQVPVDVHAADGKGI